MIFQTFKQYIEGLGFTKQPMVISVIANVLNIILNYLLIFGEVKNSNNLSYKLIIGFSFHLYNLSLLKLINH